MNTTTNATGDGTPERPGADRPAESRRRRPSPPRLVRHGRRGLMLVVALIVVTQLTPGCGAYYNTFHHARKRFNEAERQMSASGLDHPSPQVLSLYQQAIDKSEKVLANYPDSKWVDDARLMIGQARLGREEYEQARVAFQRLIDFHPESDLVPEARLGIGQCYMGLGDYDQADRIFGELLGNLPDFDRADEVLLHIARSASQRREHQLAVASFSQLIELSPEKSVMVEALRGRAESYVALEQWELAYKDFSRAAGLIKEREARYEVDLRVGHCLEQLGRYDEALGLYGRLEREMPDAQRLPRTLVQRAGVMNALGRPDEALKTYERVVEKYPGSSYAAQAQFQIGITYEIHLREYDRAKEAFGKVRERSPRSEFVQIAEARVRDLDLYGEYRQQATDGEEDQQAEAAYKLAELKLMRLQQPDEAVEAFRDIEDSYPTSRYAAKSAYAIGFVYENELGDTTAAMQAYTHVHEIYPETEYGVHAGVRAGKLDPDSLSILVGRIVMREARLDSMRLAVQITDSLRVVRAMADSLRALTVEDSLRAVAMGDSLGTGAAGGPAVIAGPGIAAGDSAAAGDTLGVSPRSVSPDADQLAMPRLQPPEGREAQIAWRDSIMAADRARRDSVNAEERRQSLIREK